MSNNCQESIKITWGPCVEWEANLAVQILKKNESDDMVNVREKYKQKTYPSFPE